MLEALKEKLGIGDNLPDPPYNYDFLLSIDEKEYPKYLKRIFKYVMNQKLNLKNPKTFNQKIQWLKLYDATPLKTQLTDKVLVRNWVKEKIGENYLKPILQICDSFDEIDFESLPNYFIIKTNHGCKWHYSVKNKEKLLSTEQLMSLVKKHFDGWMNQSFFPFAGFEMQYRDIVPKILVEPILMLNDEKEPIDIEVYCFNGEPKYTQKIRYAETREVSVYDEKLKLTDLKFMPNYVQINEPVDEIVREAVHLSKSLAEKFKLVRVDWIVCGGKLYFNEMTFTPFSGFYDFEDKNWDIKLGNLLKIK